MKHKKIGNTQFNADAFKEMSFTQFKKQYEGIIKGVSLHECFKQLGGKIKKAKPTNDE